jgi:pyruvate,water dikinase
MAQIPLSPGCSPIHFFGLDGPDSSLPDLAEVGGKGIHLCRMTQAKFPVPPGFIITTAAYLQFAAPDGLGRRIRELADSIDANDVNELAVIAAKIRAMFAESPMPADLADAITGAYRRLSGAGSEGARVAVRSSATAEDLPEASFAGQQDTYLNIRGVEAVLIAVKSCWGSLWTDRAVAYRARKNTSMDGLAMAVVVQQMVHAEAAGVMFTANPVSGDGDEIVINATWGLGEAIVSGHVTPDHITVDKATGTVKDITVSEKHVMTTMTEHGTVEAEITDDRRQARVLGDGLVQDLARIGRNIETYYGAPQDIEWALAGGKFAMLQARPIQGLAVTRDVEAGRQEEIARLLELAGGKHRAWVLHNLDETLKSPTPMTWDMIRWFMSGAGGYGQMYRDFGYSPSEQVNRDGFLELICGRIYVDPDRAAGQFWSYVPLEYKVADILEDQTTLERPPSKLNVEQADPAFFLRLPKWIWASIRSYRVMNKARAAALDRFLNHALPPFLDFLAGTRSQSLAERTTEELIGELGRRRDYVLGSFANESLKPGFFGGLAQGKMLTLLAQLMGDAAGEDLGRVLTTGLEHDTTIEQNILLYHVARGEATMDEFIAQFGHCAANEMELAHPRWREDRSYLERMLDNFRKPDARHPQQRHEEQTAHRKTVEATLMDRLAEFGGSSLYERLMVDVRDAQKMLPYRETGKHYLMMGYETIRLALLELGRRWNIGRDVFFLHYDELPRFEQDRAAMLAQVAKRKVRWESARKLVLASVIDSDQLDMLGKPEPRDPAKAGREMAARPIASGTSTGIARIVFDPENAGDLGSEYILVCPSTDPGWTPLFVNARGLIVERGGILSHGAIVARDFGIPAVVLEDATQLIPDGARISVDGSRGVIERLE